MQLKLADKPVRSDQPAHHEREGGENVLLHRKIGFTRAAVDFLLVWNVAARLDDRDLALPDESNCGLDGTVLVTVPVPIAGDEVHV